MYTDNEIYFPHHIIPSLKTLRGETWQQLIERVACRPECHEDTLAFMVMISKLNGCVSCETDSYRAMRGCTACTVQTLRRFKGPDEELVALFEEALKEIRGFARQHPSLGHLVEREWAEQPG